MAGPNITSVSPNPPIIGGQITITGTGFFGTSAVNISNNKGMTKAVAITGLQVNTTGTQITGTIPNSTLLKTGTAYVQVTVPNQPTSAPFKIQLSSTVPNITNVSPSPAVIGSTVTITGTAFTGASAVNISNNKDMTKAVAITGLQVNKNGTQITGTIPLGTKLLMNGTAYVQVTVPGQPDSVPFKIQLIGVKLGEVTSEPGPLQGQKHRSSEDFNLFNRPNAVNQLEWDITSKPSSGISFSVMYDKKGGIDPTLLTNVTNGYISDILQYTTDIYIADPKGANGDFTVTVYGL